jgi:mono/diheme cytochrome c family protein
MQTRLALALLSSALGCTAEIQGEGPTAGSAASSGAGGVPTTFGTAGSGGAPAASSGQAGAALGGAAGMPTATGGFSGGAAAGNGGQAGAGGSGPAPSEGQALYDKQCGACHGAQGVGAVLGPEIQHPLRDYGKWVVRNGRAETSFLKPMEKLGADVVSDAQLELIFDYVSEPPEPTTGSGLYADYCANCHGADAAGGPTDRNILNELDKVDELVRDGHNKGQYQMRHDSMPSFPTDIVSDSELMLIKSHIESL